MPKDQNFFFLHFFLLFVLAMDPCLLRFLGKFSKFENLQLFLGLGFIL